MDLQHCMARGGENVCNAHNPIRDDYLKKQYKNWSEMELVITFMSLPMCDSMASEPQFFHVFLGSFLWSPKQRA